VPFIALSRSTISSIAPQTSKRRTRECSSYTLGRRPTSITHAKEFLEKQAELPSNVVLVTDPEYKVTNLYGLRWDAPHETAYSLKRCEACVMAPPARIAAAMIAASASIAFAGQYFEPANP